MLSIIAAGDWKETRTGGDEADHSVERFMCQTKNQDDKIEMRQSDQLMFIALKINAILTFRFRNTTCMKRRTFRGR